MRKRVRTYRAGADGCGAGAERIATTGRAPRNDGSTARNNGYVARDDESGVPNDGSAARNNGYGSLKKIRQLRIQGRATTDVARVTMAEIMRRRVFLGQRQLRSRDDGSRVGRRWVRPCADASRPQYIRGQISSEFMLRLAAPDPSSPGVLCRTCAELF